MIFGQSNVKHTRPNSISSRGIDHWISRPVVPNRGASMGRESLRALQHWKNFGRKVFEQL